VVIFPSEYYLAQIRQGNDTHTVRIFRDMPGFNKGTAGEQAGIGSNRKQLS